MLLGTLKEIWRYPVKSMGGEQVKTATVGEHGLAGDRCWAVVDTETNEIRNAKRWPGLLNFRAELNADESLVASGYDEQVPDASIYTPTGEVLNARHPATAAALGQLLGHQIHLSPLAPPSNRDHYRLAKARSEQDIADELQLLDDEEFPDFSQTHEELMLALAECVTPPGTYVDAYALHMLSTNSLEFLRSRSGLQIDTARYRPNLLIEPAEAAAELTENQWVGQLAQLGETILEINSRTIRCSMPSREQQWAGLGAEPGMARAMVDHCERHLGVNIIIRQTGRIQVGDELRLLDNNPTS